MLLENASASFAIDHSPSSNMIVILKEGSILRRCQSPYHHRWQNCHLRVSPYFFQHVVRLPHLRKPFFVSIPIWVASVNHRSPSSRLLLIPRAQKYLTFRSGFPGLSDAVEKSTFGSLTLYRETKFIICFDFVVILSSLASCCVLFDINSKQVVKLKWLMLNKHKRWFH